MIEESVLTSLNDGFSSDLLMLSISELKTLEWWISGLRLNPLFLAWKTHDFNLQINYSTGYLDISF